jgi:hypothetical protein
MNPELVSQFCGFSPYQQLQGHVREVRNLTQRRQDAKKRQCRTKRTESGVSGKLSLISYVGQIARSCSVSVLAAAAMLLSVCSTAQCQTDVRMSYTGEYLTGNDSQGSVSSIEGYSKESPPRRRPRYTGSVQRRPDVSGVRTNQIVKAYGIGRYVDPSDCRIMHERHVIYRLEESSGWKLQPSAHQPEILMGPIVGLRRPEYAPAPLEGEVGRELIATRQNTQAAVDGVRTVTEDQVKIRKELSENLQRVSQNEETLMKQIDDLKRRMDETDGKQNRAKMPQPEGSSGVVPQPTR